MMAMHQNDNRILITLLFVFHILAIILFLHGFLTMKSALQGFSTHEEQKQKLHSLNLGNSSYTSTTSRVVLMVIDALRADFVLGTNAKMKNVEQLLVSGKAVAFRSTVDVPTVTLPRIKAITTGSIPGFIDVALNFGSSRLDDDNLLTQATLSNKRLVFYGDDTWLKLFPQHFTRSEGTTSFFVNDYTEVDDNVTRNMLEELKNQSDWDIMILHFLGLDHIGHISGPESVLIAPKLKEMDGIVKIIHEALQAEEARTGVPNLLIVCGDHGMSDSGGHGGSSPAETIVPLVFISSLTAKFRADENFNDVTEIKQVDLCPTLAVLLGLPIPKNNVGKIIPSLITHLPWHERLAADAINSNQVIEVAHHLGISTADSEFRLARDFHKMWSEHGCSNFPFHHWCFEVAHIQRMYHKGIISLRSKISAKLVHHDLIEMLMSIVIHWQVLILAICLAMQRIRTSSINFYALIPITCILFLHLIGLLTEHTFFTMDVKTAVLCVYFLLNIYTLKHTVHYKYVFMFMAQNKHSVLNILVSAFVLHTISLMSSSFVEEEHQTWYFFAATVHFAIALQFCQAVFHKPKIQDMSKYASVGYLVGSMALIRLLRDWNHTGDKWAHLSDIADWLDRAENKLYLSALVIFSLIATVAIISFDESRLGRIIVSVNAVLICWHKYAIGSIVLPLDMIKSHRGITEAGLVYCGIAFYTAVTLWQHSNCSPGKRIVAAWVQLICLLARAHNIPLLTLMVVQERLLRRGCDKTFQKSRVTMACIYVIMAQCAYFQQGNSHSLSRVDLHGGYVGLTTYIITLVAILLTCSTYAGPIFWLLSLVTEIAYTRHKDDVANVSVVMLMCRALPWALYAPCVMFQRFHLFVWTVFSPKLLFEGMFSIVYSIMAFLLIFCTSSVSKN